MNENVFPIENLGLSNVMLSVFRGSTILRAGEEGVVRRRSFFYWDFVVDSRSI